MKDNVITAFECCPIPNLSEATKTELRQLVTTSVFIHGEQEIESDEEKNIFSTNKDGNLVSYRYVGVIRTSDGTILEILPKIFQEIELKECAEESRALLVKMLEHAGLISLRKSSTASLAENSFSLLEVFIKLFLVEVTSVLRSGLQRDYQHEKNNLNCLRGKIYFPKHIKRNSTSAHKLYCRYNDYNVNCLENQLLLAALKKVVRITNSHANKKLCLQLIPQFLGISQPLFVNKTTFTKCRSDRTMKRYREALTLCRLILLSPPTPHIGQTQTEAILFDMATLFEKTVESTFKKLPSTNELCCQDNLNWFQGLGAPRPDFTITLNDTTIVADAKWKLTRNTQPTKPDQYQIFSYMQLVGAHWGILIYPQYDNLGLSTSTKYEMNLEGSPYHIVLTPFCLKKFQLQLPLSALVEGKTVTCNSQQNFLCRTT